MLQFPLSISKTDSSHPYTSKLGSKMAANQPPPAKRMRYNLRSLSQSESNAIAVEANEQIARKRTTCNATTAATRPKHSAYLLRSRGNINDSEFQCIEPKRKRKKPSLLMLNPDCLLELFGYMELRDLCAMAETCTTLNTYAKLYFRLNHKNFDFASMISGGLVGVAEASTLLRIFGNEIHTLNISRDLFKFDDDDYDEDEDISDALLNVIADSRLQNVKSLTLNTIDFESGLMADRLSTLFNSIEMLTLDNCEMGYEPWCNMNTLKVLKLNDVTGCGPYFRHVHYDQLEVAEFNRVSHVNTYDLEAFIGLVPTLRRLSIVKCWCTTIKIFDSVKDMENLEELEFQSNHPIVSEQLHHRYLMHLTSLKKLKVLKLGCNGKSVQQLIDGIREKKIAIEHLELADGRLDLATVQAIAELKTIKVLKFNDMIDFSDNLLGPIANGLDQLEEFHIKTTANISQFRIRQLVRATNRLTCLKIDAKDFELNADSYRAILIAVQCRTHKNHLAMTIYDDGNQPNQPDVVQVNGRNEKWLKVSKLDRRVNHLFPHYPWTPEDYDIDDDFFTDEEFGLGDDSDDEDIDDEGRVWDSDDDE